MDSYAAPLIGRRLLARAASAAAGALLLLSTAQAVAVVINFDDLVPGIVNSGDLIGGVTFTYDIPRSYPAPGSPTQIPVQLMVSTGSETTSPFNYLGTNDGGFLLAGDGFSLSFSTPVSSVGMYFISKDQLFDSDITLAANGSTASLVAVPVQGPLSDGGQVFFLEIGHPGATFSSVSVVTNDCGCFFYNVDDIVISAGVVPEPSTLWLLGAGLAGLGLLRRRPARSLK